MDTTAPSLRYCYYCRIFHGAEIEMVKRTTSDGRSIYRCKKSVDAVKVSQQERDAFGKTVSTANKNEARAMAVARLSTERASNKR